MPDDMPVPTVATEIIRRIATLLGLSCTGSIVLQESEIVNKIRKNDKKILRYKVAIENIIVAYEQICILNKQRFPDELYAAIMKAKDVVESK